MQKIYADLSEKNASIPQASFDAYSYITCGDAVKQSNGFLPADTCKYLSDYAKQSK